MMIAWSMLALCFLLTAVGAPITAKRRKETMQKNDVVRLVGGSLCAIGVHVVLLFITDVFSETVEALYGAEQAVFLSTVAVSIGAFLLATLTFSFVVAAFVPADGALARWRLLPMVLVTVVLGIACAVELAVCDQIAFFQLARPLVIASAVVSLLAAVDWLADMQYRYQQWIAAVINLIVIALEIVMISLFVPLGIEFYRTGALGAELAGAVGILAAAAVALFVPPILSVGAVFCRIASSFQKER